MYSASLSDLRVVVREVTRRAGARRINVTYSKEATTAMANEDSIILPVLRHPVSTEELKLHRYRALHELGHHDRPEVFDLGKRAQLPAKPFWFWNLVEDEAQERETQARWPGDRVALEEGRGIHVKRQLDEFQTYLDAGQKPSEDTVKQVAAYAVSLASRDWHRGAEGLFETHKESCGPEAEALVDELMAEGWAEKIGRNLTVPEAYDVARELYMRLYPDDAAPPTAEEAQQKEPGEGEENQGDEGEGTGKPQQKDGDPDNEDSSQEQDGDTFTINWDKLLASDHKEMLHGNTPLHVTYNGYSTGGAEFFPDDKVHTLRADDMVDRELAEPDKALGNQLRRYVQSKARSKWETERRSGRINKRALKRIVMGTEDRHRRVFQRRTDAEAINTAITLLVDCSGSMGIRDRDRSAAEAAATLVDAFSKVLRIPTEVIGHTYKYDGPELHVAKEFNEQRPGSEIGRSLLAIDMCGNADGDVLLAAAERLVKRKETRKIIVFISDGQPADSYAGNAPGVLKLAVDEVNRMGLELYGIGIGFKELGHFIPDYTYLPDDSPVTPVLLETVQKFVLKN